MIKNHLILSGTVCKKPICKVSPSGILHSQFMLEHRSIQKESGYIRKAWCVLPVVVSGKKTFEIISIISAGVQMTLKGFISCHQGRNGLTRIVLHADAGQINFFNLGD